jgi:hypothetical protein
LVESLLNIGLQAPDLFEEVSNGVRDLWTTGLDRNLCPPKDVREFTFGVKANVRAKANATVLEKLYSRLNRLEPLNP